MNDKLDVDYIIDLENSLDKEVDRKNAAYRILRHLCGGDARDFNKLEEMIDNGDTDSLCKGIAIELSEEDKDWLVPLAHSYGLTLGDWMQTIMNRWLDTNRPYRP